jgi:hypothetical protein
MPVIKCSNGKYRIGSGQCIYDSKEKATEVWTAILAGGKYSYKKPNEKKTKTKGNG